MPKLAKGKNSFYTQLPIDLLRILDAKAKYFNMSKSEIVESALTDWVYKTDDTAPITITDGVRKEIFKTYLATDIKRAIYRLAEEKEKHDIDIFDGLLRFAFGYFEIPLDSTKDSLPS